MTDINLAFNLAEQIHDGADIEDQDMNFLHRLQQEQAVRIAQALGR